MNDGLLGYPNNFQQSSLLGSPSNNYTNHPLTYGLPGPTGYLFDVAVSGSVNLLVTISDGLLAVWEVGGVQIFGADTNGQYNFSDSEIKSIYLKVSNDLAVTRFSTTTTLNQNYKNLNIEKILKRFPNLLRLEIRDANPVLGGLDLSFTQLQLLDLRNLVFNGIAYFKLPKSVTSVFFSDCNLNNCTIPDLSICNFGTTGSLFFIRCNCTGEFFQSQFPLGDIPTIRLEGNKLTGLIPIPPYSSLTTLWLFDNLFTNYYESLDNCFNLKDLRLQNNLLIQSAVDAILIAIWSNEQVRPVKFTGCVLNLGGTGNAAPSSSGLAAKSGLTVSGNWTVITN